jgi:hypothetical protein
MLRKSSSMTAPFDLLTAIQSRTARIAVGPSTVRGLGVPGVVAAARTFLREMPLQPFATSRPKTFRKVLDAQTLALQNALPRHARHWGVARKVLNIFIRDAVYATHLREAYGLSASEHLLEIPLDSLTGEELYQSSRPRLPRWPGVRHLSPDVSDRFQLEAQRIAAAVPTARIHLDAYWWSVKRDAPTS